MRVIDKLVQVKTEEEVLKYAAAFMQLYCEEAYYLERTAPWIERVGLAYVKQRLVEDERKTLQALPALAGSSTGGSME